MEQESEEVVNPFCCVHCLKNICWKMEWMKVILLKWILI